MYLIVRSTALLLIISSVVQAEAPTPPTLFESIKHFFSNKQNQGAKMDTPLEGQPEDAKIDTPSLGTWGTINRFFQEKTTAQAPTKKIIIPQTGASGIASEVEPQPGNKDGVQNPAVVQDLSQEHTIIPHKATYTISLEKNYGDDVSDASGEMTINVYDTGDGYVFEQNSRLIIYNGDGEGEQIVTNLATWQNYDGSQYRFNSKTARNGEQEEIIKGHAVKNSSKNLTTISYSRPTESEITTPYDTVFPLHHLIHALKMAKAGKPVVSNIVFDGSSETHEAVNVDTILGAPKPSGLTIKTDKDISTRHQWPMRLAVYIPGTSDSEADYEMEQNVLDSGVIKDMTLDYGVFQVKATLKEIDFYEPLKQTP